MRTSGSWAKSDERILVIADPKDLRDNVVEVLRPEGFVVFEQPSAIGATRSIRDHSIRAVVIDACTPSARGDKLVSVLRENPRLQGLVVVAVTEGGSNEGLAAADATVDRNSVVQRLVPALVKLLRNSNFDPQEAFSLVSTKSS